MNCATQAIARMMPSGTDRAALPRRAAASKLDMKHVYHD